MDWITRIQDILAGKLPKGVKRSPHWSATRAKHLKAHSACAVCGETKNLNVHHILPFWLFPESELDPANLITLCEKFHHHLFFGHLLSFKSFNLSVRRDAKAWLDKLRNRPAPCARIAPASTSPIK